MCVCTGVFAQQTKKQPTVAVTPFEVVAGYVSDDDATYLTAEFFSRLSGDERVTVANREVLGQTLRELEFQKSDWSDPNKTVRLGKALNATCLVRGMIWNRGTIRLIVEFYDVNTGKVLGSSGSGKSFSDIDDAAVNGTSPMIKELMQILTARGLLPKPEEPKKPKAFANHAKTYLGVSMDVVSKVHSGDENESLNFGFTVDASLLPPCLSSDIARIGFGASYWLPRHAYGGTRKIKDDYYDYDILSRSFSDWALYATVLIYPGGPDQDNDFYFKGNLGYNQPIFSKLDGGVEKSQVEKIKGGFYFGFGLGIEVGSKTRWVLEVLYNNYFWTHSYAGVGHSAGYNCFTISTGFRFW